MADKDNFSNYLKRNKLNYFKITKNGWIFCCEVSTDPFYKLVQDLY